MELIPVTCDDFEKRMIFLMEKRKKSYKPRKRRVKTKELFDEIIKSGNIVTKLNDILKYYSNIESAYCTIREAIRNYKRVNDLKVIRIDDDLYVINKDLLSDEKAIDWNIMFSI